MAKRTMIVRMGRNIKIVGALDHANTTDNDNENGGEQHDDGNEDQMDEDEDVEKMPKKGKDGKKGV